LIRFENFTFYYNDKTEPTLKNINLEIHDGEFILITGPSGSGKSTLCRCLNGLIPHFYGGTIKGRVEVQGLDTSKHPTRKLALKVGLVLQDPENQLVTTEVEREIAFGLENLASLKEAIARRVEEALSTVGISSLRHRPIPELSTGEKQKVAIASILTLHPEVLVLDEPTSQLDPESAEAILTLVERLNNDLGITVILIEHRLERVIQYVDRLIVVNQGEIVADGEPKQVLAHKNKDNFALAVPPVVALVQELRERGFEIDDTPLTVKEARTTLEGFLRKPSAGRLPDVGQPTHSVTPCVASVATLPQNDSRWIVTKREARWGSPKNHQISQSEIKGKELIKVEGLWFIYPEGATALKNINLRICQGEFIAIMGRNASGKTTLVKQFNGLLKPTKGKVWVEGINTTKASVAELARKVGLVLQNPNDHLFADTVEEELAFILKNLNFGKEEIGTRISKILKEFEMEEYRFSYPRSLSGGERQRVALMSVVIAQPQVLILDEPTRGMESRLKQELMRFFRQYQAQGHTIIMVTHDVEMAAEFADRVILLSEGRIIVDDTRQNALSDGLFFSPQVNRLMQGFERFGFPGNILTVEEAIKLLT
jgi:energy-coupling factor transport system ATP-binding protein